MVEVDLGRIVPLFLVFGALLALCGMTIAVAIYTTKRSPRHVRQ